MSSADTLNCRIQGEVVELAASIKAVVDKFKQLHEPLAESKDNVPKATKQLDKVSEQTEVAAHQMLDRIEKITKRDQDVISALKKIRENPADVTSPEVGKLLDGMIEKVESNCNDAFSIMDALQFQDITAQQMDHAASLLEDIEMKLIGIVGVLDGQQEHINDIEVTIQRKTRAFDPHADLLEAKTDQKDIDNLVQRNLKNK